MLKPQPLGARFTMWPLHLTLLQWFTASSLEVVCEELEKVLHGFPVVKAQVGKRAYFSGRKPVLLVEPSAELRALHMTLFDFVKNNWLFNGRYAGEYFTPHVTQQGGRDSDLDKLIIDRVTIAEGLPQGYRQVVGNIKLGN